MENEDSGIFGCYPQAGDNEAARAREIRGAFDALGGADAEVALYELANAKMPFGKYAGMLLVDLPENYVLWFKGKGYPEGRLGEQLRAIEEIKTNGLEFLLKPLSGGEISTY